MPTEKPRISVMVSDAMHAEITQYQKEYNFKSSSGAAQDLIRKGIEYLSETGLLSTSKKAPSLSDEALIIARQYESLGKRDRLIIGTLVDVMTTNRGAGHLHIVQQAAKSGDRMDELLTDEELAERSKYLGESPRPDDTEE